jgi:hypothetical protein
MLRQFSIAALVMVMWPVAGGCGDNQTHPDAVTYDAGAVQSLSCVPNLDGKIDRAELGAAIGVPARYLVSPPGVSRPVNLAGGTDAAGHKIWDFSSSYADDQAATLTASTLTGKWYEASFPGAGFVSSFDAGGTIEAVYSEDDSAIYLLGLASAQKSPPEGQTLYVYDAPVPFLRFPLVPGKAWTSVGTSKNQMLRGLPFAGKDTYEVSVDAEGQLVLPELTFTQAIRVRTKLTIEPTVGATTTQLQTSYFFECFGEVARATSKTGEANLDFSAAAEVRRLGLPR